ncbi:MAG: DUF4929 family protein [Flavobacteriaceae bacterium]|nr:DUF4929 family protein [Flavobacteriaceae bacterium]
MRTITTVIKFFLLGMLIISCSDEDVEEQLPLTVTLISKGTTQAIEGQEAVFTFDIVLSRASNTDINLNFALNNDNSSYADLLSINSPLVVSANQTKATLEIFSSEKRDSEYMLSDDQSFSISLESYTGTDEEITLEKMESVSLKAQEEVLPLSDEQIELLNHYKENGMDLSLWIGNIPVTVTVESPADGYYAFAESFEKTYTGLSNISLSETADADNPMLVMNTNAFGLSEHLQYVFRNETIENTEGWYMPGDEYAPPAPLYILNVLGEEKVQKWINKEYSFDVKVDKLLFNTDNSVKYIYEDEAYNTPYSDEGVDIRDEYEAITGVNFQYDFPLWNELKESCKTNSELFENVYYGGSLHPDHYIMYSTISEDDWYNEPSNFKEYTSSYNQETGEMTYKFNIDHASAGGYTIVTVTYQSPYINN